jgi:hypothetical protein
MGDFAEISGQRPEPQPPRDEVIRRAREKLMRTIEQEQNTTIRDQQARVPDLATTRRRRQVIRVVAGIGAAAAIAALAVVVNQDGPVKPDQQSVVASGPVGVLQHAATVVVALDPAGHGTIRHLRFTNLTDAGHPTYDAYVRPNGSALVGIANGVLEATDGYLTSAQLADLPADPPALLEKLMTMSHHLGYESPDERPERGLYRLATTLLPDPAVSPEVKGAIYRVLANLDLKAVRARDLGVGSDDAGRTGQVLEFTFAEGYVDRLVLDPKTGALLATKTLDRDGKLVGGQVYISSELVEQMPQSVA